MESRDYSSLIMCFVRCNVIGIKFALLFVRVIRKYIRYRDKFIKIWIQGYMLMRY